MPALRPDLPPYYYVEHFLEMLDFVARVYGAMLAPVHQAFIGDFRALPRQAQCLYVRMANRRGLVFAEAALDYAEIGTTAPAVARLADAGFARRAGATDLPAILQRQTKPALLALAAKAGIAVKSNWPKARLAEALAPALPADTMPFDDYLVRLRHEALDYILFLYFGRCETDLKSFALRDLGIVAVHERQDFAARFADAAEATSCLPTAGGANTCAPHRKTPRRRWLIWQGRQPRHLNTPRPCGPKSRMPPDSISSGWATPLPPLPPTAMATHRIAGSGLCACSMPAAICRRRERCSNA